MFLFYSAWGGENINNVLSLYPKQLVVILEMARFLVPFFLHLLLKMAICKGREKDQRWGIANGEESGKKTWRAWPT